MSKDREPVSLSDFLTENNVHPTWRRLILENNEVEVALKECLDEIVNNRMRYPTFEPPRECILRALAYLPPKDIKVVIVGHDPIPGGLATGLAFSFPRGKMHTKPSTDTDVDHEDREGKTMHILHDVLCRAGYLSKGCYYDCCGEAWAHRGVLLWNGALTLHPNKRKKNGVNELMIDGRYKLWTDFGVNLLRHLLEIVPDVLFLCMGTWGGKIGTKLKEIPDADVCVCDHPTYPKSPDPNNFEENADEFFKSVKEKHDELFWLAPKPKGLKNKMGALSLNPGHNDHS